ncbi:MAG: AMP-binding protein, partial [Bryobacteraceae bacterium]|nr:AMP-binding protein [Bryobacteraceae bacterium]
MSAAAQSNAIEDIYELSPLQQGMLFHCLYNPKTWMYFEQVVVPVRNRVNADCLIRAWKRVLERHPALRTSFHWEGLDKPLQVVHREVEFSIERHDWSGVDAGERERRLEDFLKADRDRGFVLSGAPLIRLALVQFSEEDFRYILSFHHLLMDGWSLQVVNREVSVLYEAYCLGREMQLEASRPYGDYIAWLQGQNAEAGKTFWREMLSGFEGPAPLGAERSPGAERTEEVYSEQEMRLPREATAALQSLAQRTHVTLNTVMLGAWALLLSRYSGEEEVVFGSVVSGRPPELRGVESMVGLFINTLPVRTQIHDETPLSGWLQRLQEHHLEARRYEFTSLTDIHTWSGRPAGMPLFQSVLAFENYPTGAMSTPQAENFEGFRQFERTNYPLSAVVVPGAELLVRILYDLHRFEDSTITRLLGHLETILVSMGGDAEQRLGDVSVLPPAEVRQLMVEWNNTKVEQAGTQCVHRLFEAQVERTPDAPALAFGGQRVTYRSLNAQANQLARSLQTLGLRAGSLAGISMERSPQWIAAVLAVWKAGAAYVPLDPALPPERLSFMVKDAGLDVLLTQEELRAALPPDVSNLEDMATPRDAAYVIYTSGSTGRPKGVVVEHRGLSNTAEATVRTLGLGPGDRVLQFAPWSFDASVYELMMTLLS